MNPALLIKQAFDPFYNAPLAVWEQFVALGEVVQSGKEEVIKPAHTIETYLSFILEGSGGILLWKEGQAVCIDMCYEGEFFGDYMSFLVQQPSPLEVVTFEQTTLFRISSKQFTALGQLELGNTIMRMAAESLFAHKQQQQIDILTKTAEQRYRELMNAYPERLLRTPQKYFASYLGITPQSLSRIRKQLSLMH